MNKLQENLNSVFTHYSNYLNELDKDVSSLTPSIIHVNDSIYIDMIMSYWNHKERLDIFINARLINRNVNYTWDSINDDCWVDNNKGVIYNLCIPLLNFDVNDTIDLNDNPRVDIFKEIVITRVSSHLTSIDV